MLFCQGQGIAQTFPTGFSRITVVNGIANPTVMAFTPDGRIFVGEQSGRLRVIKSEVLLTTPFVTLSVSSSGERGLIGVALDPDFSSNGYVYLYYTLPDGSRNRVSRFTGSGDVAVPGSEQIILDLDPLSLATNHNGGAMHFGPDGKLYVAIGENALPANAQNLNTLMVNYCVSMLTGVFQPGIHLPMDPNNEGGSGHLARQGLAKHHHTLSDTPNGVGIRIETRRIPAQAFRHGQRLHPKVHCERVGAGPPSTDGRM